MRRELEVRQAEEEAFGELWRHRDAVLAERDNRGTVGHTLSDYERGQVEGKLSALRWVLGDDWGNLDT